MGIPRSSDLGGQGKGIPRKPVMPSENKNGETVRKAAERPVEQPQTGAKQPSRRFTDEQLAQIRREQIRRQRLAEQKGSQQGQQPQPQRAAAPSSSSNGNNKTAQPQRKTERTSVAENRNIEKSRVESNKNRRDSTEQARKSKPRAATPVPSSVNEDIDDGYAIDPKTGKKYKKLPNVPKDVVRADKKSGGLSLEQLRNSIPEADFDLDDLNGAADLFLAHLRVPPDKEEMKRLREERLRRAKKQNAEYEDVAEALDEKYGSLEPDPDEVWNGE